MTDGLGERCLVAGANGNLCAGDGAAGTAIDEVNAGVLRRLATRTESSMRPAAVHPIGA